MEATFWRHWWWNGGYFGAIFAMKQQLPKATVSWRNTCFLSNLPSFASPNGCPVQGKMVVLVADGQTKSAELTNNLIAGTIGGFIGTALNTPCKWTTQFFHRFSLLLFSSFRQHQMRSQHLLSTRALSPAMAHSGRKDLADPQSTWSRPESNLPVQANGPTLLYSESHVKKAQEHCTRVSHRKY